MAHSPASFKRSKPRYRPLPTVLVICEDSKSGKRYLDDASCHFRATVTVEITHCGNTDPKGIVTEALVRQSKFNHVFCVIDRDNHPSFKEALELAKTSANVEIIASYPCFEFWLLLHFGYTRKPYTAVGNDSAAARLIRDLRAFPDMEHYDKGGNRSVFEQLLGEKFDFARKTAPQILSAAMDSDEMNPSTRLHELLEFFGKLSKPQLK